MDYPLLTMVTTAVWLLMFTSVFVAFGWCDPNEYKRKIGMDIFSGIMFFTSFKVLSKFSDIMYASVTPHVEGDPLVSISMIQSFSEGFYAQFNFASIFDKVENELTALIVIGVSIMLLLVLAVVSLVFAVYFIFRICTLIDVYITNIIRYSIMGVAFILMLIIGVPANQPKLLSIAVIIAVASIAKLAIGHALLVYKDDILIFFGKEPKQAQPVHAPAQAPSQQTRTRQSQQPQQQRPTSQAPQQRPQQQRPMGQPPQQRPQQRPMGQPPQNIQGNRPPQQRPTTQAPQRPQQQRPTQINSQNKKDDDFAEQMRNMAMRYETGSHNTNYANQLKNSTINQNHNK